MRTTASDRVNQFPTQNTNASQSIVLSDGDAEGTRVACLNLFRHIFEETLEITKQAKTISERVK